MKGLRAYGGLAWRNNRLVKPLPGEVTPELFSDYLSRDTSRIVYTNAAGGVAIEDTKSGGVHLDWKKLGREDIDNHKDIVLLGEYEGSMFFSRSRDDLKLTNIRSLLTPERLDLESERQRSIAGRAMSVTRWLSNSQYCGACGSANEKMEGGAFMQCTSSKCKGVTYPRVDPVMITACLNTKGTHILLGRKAEWPPNRYSCLAGFMEPGESVEETCVREVHEEAGVHIDPHRVSILTTQPWPLGPSFSSQLMIGCISHASDDNIRVNKDEIEDAKWFDVEMVRNLVRSIHEGNSPPKSPPLAIPSPWAIAFHLIEHVCSQR